VSNILEIALGVTGGRAVLSALAGVNGSLASLAGTALSVGTAVNGIKGALDMGGELNDLRARTGQSVRDLVVLRRTFDNAGIGASATAPMIGLLHKAISGMNEEGGKTDGVFKRLGVSQESLRNMSAVQQMATLTAAFTKITNPAERSATAMQLFGRSGGQMLQLLGDSSAIGTAEREVGRLGDRVQENAERFDEIGDRLSVAKLRLQEFWVVAAEKAIPALQRMANLMQGLNPSVAGATMGSAATIAGVLFAGAMVSKLDSAVLNWATRQGSPIGQAFAGRFLAPMTGALARVLPIGLAAAVTAAVLVGIASAYAEWRNGQLAAANSGFDSLGKVRGATTAMRSDVDRKAVLAQVKELQKTTADALKVEEGRWIKNEQAIASYREQLEQLAALEKLLNSQRVAAIIAENKKADNLSAVAKDRADAAAWLAGGRDATDRGQNGDEASKLRQDIADAKNERMDPAARLALLRTDLRLREQALMVMEQQKAAGQNDALLQKNNLVTTGAREKILKDIAETEEKLVRLESERAQRALDEQLRTINARRAAIDADFTRTQAEKWAEKKQLIADEIAAQQRYIDVLRQRQAVTTDVAARETLASSISGGLDKLSGLQGDQAGMGPNPNSWLQQMQSSLTQLRESWGTTAMQIGQTISGTIGTAMNGVSSTLTSMVMKTTDWRDTLMQARIAIATQLVQAIIDMGLRWVATQIMMATMGKTIAAASTAALLPLAAAQAAIWATPATLATIASFGGAAVQAPASIGGALAATKGMALLNGFEDGGADRRAARPHRRRGPR